ncbi:MAG: methyltransferase [Calditrichaeota bacterium]|nr:methyltransferase [Calditrichota bacterium]MCB0303864.1 methyltransferase [Calditrichota bacterium]MCB9087054.1 methyltransferase [Calditrichia bacterium]
MLKIVQDNHLHFLKLFLKNPAEVGAIWPSSSELARAMIRDLALKPGEAVLELGPGTGAFTAHIRSILPDPRAYIGIECEPNFVRLLERNFPDLRFIVGRAENANELYEKAGIFPARAIISGIPFANHWGEIGNHIIDALEHLMTPGCIFRTFQYVHAYTLPPAFKFRQRMTRVFGPCQRSRIVFRNLPPAFVLTWTR